MKRIFLTLIIGFATSFALAQKKLKTALECINKGDYTSAIQKINAYEAKENKSAESNFLKYMIKKANIRSVEDADSAYEFYYAAFTLLSQYKQKDKEDACKDFLICETNKSTESFDLDRIVYLEYLKTYNSSVLSAFQNKYPTSPFLTEILKVADSVDFVNTSQTNDIQKNQIIFERKPGSAYRKEAKELLVNLSFQEAVSKNNILAYEEFIKSFPEAKQVKEANTYLEEAYWKIALVNVSIEKLNEYIIAFPNSVFKVKAQEKIENMEWQLAQGSNTEYSYKDFINKYPESEYANEAKRRLSAMKDYIFPYLNRNKKYMLYDADNNIFTSEEEYDFLGMLDSSLFIASSHNKYGVITNLGKKILPLTYNCIRLTGNNLCVELGDKKGLFNFKGEKILDFLYDDITDMPPFIKVGTGNYQTGIKQGLFDQKGEKIFDCEYNSIEVVNDRLFILTKNNLSFLSDTRGNVLSQNYKSIFHPRDQFFIVNNNNKYGLIDTVGKVVVPCTYENIDYAYIDSENELTNAYRFFIVKNKASQEGIVNQTGTFVLPMQKGIIKYVGKQCFSIEISTNDKNANKVKLYNASTMSFVGNESFEWINAFNEGLARAGKNNKSGFINTNAEWVIAPVYSQEDPHLYDDAHGGVGDMGEFPNYLDDVDIPFSSCTSFDNKKVKGTENYGPTGFPDFNENRAVVQIDNKFGYIDKSGKVIIPIIYFYASGFQNGLANVTIEEGEKFTQLVIDKEGNAVFSNGSITHFLDNGKKALLTGGDGYYILDISSNMKTNLLTLDKSEWVTPSGNHFIGEFKQKDVFILNSGIVLFDPDIDFSNYDLAKKVEDVISKFYASDIKNAISDFEVLLNNHPENYTIHYYLAKCYQQKNDYYNANSYYSKAIEINPNKQEARLDRMKLCYDKNYWREALSDLEYLIAQSTYFDQDLIFKRAYCQSQIGNNDAAFSDYSELIRVNPNYSYAFNNRGVIYLSKRLYQLAINDFSSAIKTVSKTDTDGLKLFHNNKGNTLLKLNRKSEACIEWKKAASYGSTESAQNLRIYCK